ncbi:hypothetical protein CIHG_07455 [Coccidioides immitis H538.4]|uniref:DNA polymerase delta subunit 4 n=1 Tax=Coccidioides immitis H538.4 TaxID=396776 RepID=A0A0J8UQ69_COCIT|nr:hypothetical protein CIHG_07455 [Coccidioides immitis H538.4]
MPPTRRRSGNPASTRHQQTLSFGTKSRISKPTSGPSSKHLKDISSPSPTAEPELAGRKGVSKSPSPAAPTLVADVAEQEVVVPAQPIAASSKSENVVREQARVQLQAPKSAEDKKAEALTEEDIRRYWEAEEAKMSAPRVHQEGLSIHEKILRHFDLSNQYGPCIGIARIKRWRRAHTLDLNPPIEVLAVLLKDEARGVAREKAYIDELLS